MVNEWEREDRFANWLERGVYFLLLAVYALILAAMIHGPDWPKSNSVWVESIQFQPCRQVWRMGVGSKPPGPEFALEWQCDHW